MPLSRQWSYPAVDVSTTITGDAVVVVPNSSSDPGFNLNADSVSTPTLVTAPPSSASVYAPASYTANAASVATVVQNTLGYDANFVAYFQGTASVATFRVGTGATATPAMTTVATSISSTLLTSYDFPAYVPSGYYFSFQASQANGASVPSAGLTIIAHPV
jgi:hypothetical protein